MELNKIKALLETYFEGNTSLLEEEVLRDYFTGNQVAEELQQYKPLFLGFEIAKEEKTEIDISLGSKKSSGIKKWWYAAAAILIFAIGIGNLDFSKSNEEQEALLALMKTREAMVLLSNNFNKGAEQLVLMEQFEIAKGKVLKN